MRLCDTPPLPQHKAGAALTACDLEVGTGLRL